MKIRFRFQLRPWVIVATLGMGLATLIAPLAIAAPPGARYYTYQGKKILLEPMESRITVGMREGASLDLQESLTLPSGKLEVTAQPAGKGVHIVRLGREGVLSGSSLQYGPARGPSGLPVLKAPLTLPGQAPAAASRGETRSQGGGMAESLKPEEVRTRRKEALEHYRAHGSVEWVYFAQRDPATGNVLYLTPRILIRTDETADETMDVAALRKSLPPSVRLVRPLLFTENQYLLELTSPGTDHPLDVAASLEEGYSWIEWAHPDFIQQWRRSAIPDDPKYTAYQWHHNNTGQGGGSAGADSRLEGAWDTVTGDGSVVIAIIDDGVQTDHPDLASRIFVNPDEIPGNGIDDDGNGLVDDVNGWDFAENDNNPNGWDANSSHGTAVAGVAAAAGDNGVGVSGACWNCTILPVRIFDDFGNAYDSKIVSALNYAGEMADVLNNSWGGGLPTPALNDAIVNVHTTLGKPLIFASGNYGSGYRTYILGGFTADTYVFEWEYSKDFMLSKGFDTMWLDNVIFPGGGTMEDFEGCSANAGTLADWDSTGHAGWTVTADESRASSGWGGNCAAKAGAIADNQRTVLRVEKTVGAGNLVFDLWVSSEDTGSGQLVSTGPCYDGFRLYIDGILQPFFACGDYSNQGVKLEDGKILYPASHGETIAVGASSDYDHRSEYSQWGPGLDVLAPSGGGASGISTTDLTGSRGYNTSSGPNGDYESGFSGTSSSTPLVSGIVGLLLTQDLTANGSITLGPEAIRTALHDASRWGGCQGAESDPQYGHGVLDANKLINPADAVSTTPATCATVGTADFNISFPAIPTGVIAFPSESSLTVFWSGDGSATTYTVYWSGSSPVDTGSALNSGPIEGSPYTITGLINYDVYYIVVTATNVKGVSSPSPEISAVPVPAPPAPTGVSAVPGVDSITIDWAEDASADSYTVYIGLSSPLDLSSAFKFDNLPGAPVIFTGFIVGQIYYFAVTATNTFGEGPPSSEVSAYVTSGGGSTNPRSSGGGGCLISWMTEDYLADARLDPLRSLRDFIAEQGEWGKALVRSYYRFSDTIIAWLEAPRQANALPPLMASI